MQASPALLLQLAVCFSSTVKRDHKMKRQLWHTPSSTGSSSGALPSLPLLLFFFSPVYRKRTASVCKCCYETRPHKCPFSSPGNYLPTDILPDHTWSRFCSATVRHRPDPSFTLCELYPLYAQKKRLSPNTRFHQVKKAPARFAFLKYQVLHFLF